MSLISLVSMMPPKKPAADSAAAPPTSSKPPAEEAAGKNKPAELHKVAAHPSTATMVREALQALDSRKGVTSQAIQKYIKLKYLSVDVVRLKHLVRRALKKGLETGTLVRPVNSSVTTGAVGRFRLAPKVKEPKSKSENTDPNVQKAPKEVKDGDKQPQKAGTKKKNSADGAVKSTETVKPPKNSKKAEAAAPSKVAPAKKPKAKRAEATGGEGNSTSTKTKATKKGTGPKTVKASENRAAQAGSDAPVPKATRAKKTE